MSDTVDLDVAVIGAGFGGLYAVHKMRNKLGLNVMGFDSAADIGGTWFWNTYPGARSDTEVTAYCYLNDRELFEEWEWSEKYPTQPEISAYLHHCVDRWGIRDNISLNTWIKSTSFNEATGRWELLTDSGDRYTAQFIIEGVGLLSSTNFPDYPGQSSFEGEIYHTARWPHEKVDVAGKRVAVIGTGSSGTQVIVEMAKEAGDLYVFQRTAQYCVPAQHGPINAELRERILGDFDTYRDSVLGSVTAFGFPESPVPAMSVTAEEREAVFEDAWLQGNGFRFMFASFGDLGVDPDANDAATDFLKRKMAGIVKDADTLATLTPTDYWARRPLCNDGYFHVFNQSNVHLVDVKKDPIVEITPSGVRTDNVEYDVDIIILATGFDAVSGAYIRFDQAGRGGVALQEKWRDRPLATYGMMVSGFPNMFMIYGPMGPFTNQPPVHEWQVDWMADAIQYVRDNDLSTIEPTPEFEAEWMQICDDIAYSTLFMKVNSWINGSNVVGKQVTNYFYMGGMGAYRDAVAPAQSQGYPGFALGGV